MVQSSFYGDTPNYAEDYPTQNDSNTNDGPNTPAPSSFYPDGGVYEQLANSDEVLEAADAASAAATAAAASAAAAAASAASFALYAPLASPALTGNPTAPTPTPGDNDTSIATTAFVTAAVAAGGGGGGGGTPSTANPLMDGVAAPGTATPYSREDHVHPTDTSRASASATTAALALKADLASPALTGNPTAPTQTAGDNSTKLATTAFVDAARVVLAAVDALKAPLASPALTGTPTAPTASPGTNTTQIATTAYADAIAALKANLASPPLTGTPTAPTAAVGTNTTQLATTAYVLANAASATPLIASGAGAVGTATQHAREDHVHPIDNTAWTAWTPTVTAGGGTITTVGAVTARYKQVGKTVFFYISITITTNGTGVSYVQATLPFTAANTAFQIAVGRENSLTGKTLGARIVANTANLQLTNYDGTYPGANGALLCGAGQYETT